MRHIQIIEKYMKHRLNLLIFFTGEDTSLTIQLNRPMVSEIGQRFTLRDGRITLGTGVITKILPNVQKDAS